jgi:hypothetical protein
VDIKQEENLDDYLFGSTKYIQYQTLNEMIYERKQVVYKHLSKFIDYFFPGRKIGEENFRNSSFGIFFQKDLIVKI